MVVDETRSIHEAKLNKSHPILAPDTGYSTSSMIPSLPQSATPWAADIQNVYQTLNDIYNRANNALTFNAMDAFRMQYHYNNVLQDAIPLLDAVEQHTKAGEVQLIAWLEEVVNSYKLLICQLQDAAATTTGKMSSLSQHSTHIDQAASQTHRPCFLEEAMKPGRNITIATLARQLGVDRKTIYNYLKKYNLSKEFTAISDEDLDHLVHDFRTKYPESGIRYLRGFLRTHNIRIQRHRAMASLARVDGLGKYCAADARRYKDVTSLQASNNNRASTVLHMFLDGCARYGIPSRVRGDRGGENRDVSVFMILVRGAKRASFMWGTSTHNTRIERLWGEVGGQFARAWRGFFHRLQQRHQLDRNNPHHLWILHRLFLTMINNDCEEFRVNWNSHPISGEGHEQSPDDLRFMGNLQHGVYQRNTNTLSGSIPNLSLRSDETDEWEDIVPNMEDLVADPEAWHAAFDETDVRDEPVKVPSSGCPFAAEEHEVFERLLQSLQDQAIVPAGYGILPSEWMEDGYPQVEVIKSGKRGHKELQVVLPDEVWRPRAEYWVQALHLYDSWRVL
ncbi:Integrase catalytic domain-containing protein [Salix suchowensis]|nr:Integrase catalytic domain-containing protein [Salix suchowensis]